MCDDSDARARTFFEKSATKLKSKQIKSGFMDCKKKLPTGESARKRFQLKKSVGDPIIVVAANSKKPRQVRNY